MDRHFHPICISISSNEKKSSFCFVFETLKKWNFNPTILVSDASEAIRQGFIEFFGSTNKVQLVMCWAHVRRNLQKHLKKSQHELLSDIETIQLCSNTIQFNKAKYCFIKKHIQKSPETIEYLTKQWFTSHIGWYEGYIENVNIPSTNNALESFNLLIKKEGTFRERLPLRRFLIVASCLARRWSQSYENGKQYINSPTIKLNDWIKGYDYAKSNIKISSSNQKFYLPSTSKLEPISYQDILNFQEWDDFDNFKKKAFSIWEVTLDNLDNSRCTCPYFLKNFKCKHIIGLLIRLKKITVPIEAKQISIGQKRKKGRPKKAYKALLVD